MDDIKLIIIFVFFTIIVILFCVFDYEYNSNKISSIKCYNNNQIILEEHDINYMGYRSGMVKFKKNNRIYRVISSGCIIIE